MILKQLKPRKALNKAYLKLKPDRERIDLFKANLIQLLDRIDDSESEEYHKNLISDFLKNTYYKDDHFINTKERADLVIHNGKNRASTVGVIIETKRPSNKWEMITPGEINAKAFHELLLYYLRERITNSNLEIRNLIVTNIHEWFIFDSDVFERNFAQNKALIRQFETFERSKQRTEVFYTEIAHPFIESLRNEIEFAYFDIRDYNKPLRNDNPDDDNKLIALYKLLSAEHLLKLPFANDSNTLDKGFYGELLYIMGLSESKEGGKKLIGREQEGKRNIGSLIENAINELDSLDKISRLDKPSQYGDNMQERLFNVGLELSITWMNRILFMKLLEAQLIKYHNGNRQYEFLNIDKIQNYDDLNSLFFKVLARKLSDRGVTTKEAFEKVPYLNSSLFEPTELEHTTLFVSNLGDSRELPIYSATVLKDDNGKRRTGKMNPLQYLFEFLDSYDFTSEGSEAIQEDNKTLINASVLGLIFEKINGYKDGSFFTPGFITMYMCRETIRKAVLQKFNETKGWKCSNFDDLYDEIDDRKEANDIINSLKICDPAVGSGHFLVSALNEIIAIKNDLRILSDREGRRLKEYHVVVENDELIVTDEDGAIFEYNPTNLKGESQRVQEALFYEKQTIIENCLFGVDINPNSVKICRLRLWIELLKNAYYKNETELETLPNIDINIKCGNSLVSRFALDANLGQALKKSKWTIDSYRVAVSTYRNAHNKEEKRAMERLMVSIKNDFRSEIAGNDPKIKRLAKIKGEMQFLTTQTSLFDQSKKEKKEWNEKVEKIAKEIEKLETEIEEIKANKIYENAFEWRFEFPEVLNDEGDFVGFDVVIGNPPYIKEYEGKEIFDGLRDNEVYQGKMDIWYMFGSDGIGLLKENGYLNFIAPNNWITNAGANNFRNFLLENSRIVELIDFGSFMVFDSASIQTMIMVFKNQKINNYSFHFSKLKLEKPTTKDAIELLDKVESGKNTFIEPIVVKEKLIDKSFTFSADETESILEKINCASNFKIDGKKEIAQGIVPNPDIVNIRNISKLPKEQVVSKNIKIGDGVFIVDKNHFNNLNPEELKYIKPVYEPYLIEKFLINSYDKEIIYITKTNYKNDAPSLISHLEKYKEIMDDRRENRSGRLSFNHLHWPRDEYFFEAGEKILSVRKCKKPTFAYTDKEAYVMMSFNIIRSKRINLKYLTGLLNSKLIEFWLKHKGKMQGSNFQIDKGPLLDIPIVKPSENNQSKVSDIVLNIIELKKQSPTADTTTLESEIDQLVYELYGLTEEEIGIVENSLK